MKRTASPLTRSLRTAAVLAVIATLTTWIATGGHVGWTQTSAVTMQHDEITGIDYPVRHSTFVAGVEVVAVGIAAAAALAGTSLLTARRQTVRA